MFHRMILQPTNQDVNPDLVQDHQLKEEEIRRLYMNFQGQITLSIKYKQRSDLATGLGA